MKNILIVVALAFFAFTPGRGQDQGKETRPEETPKLEIPEITIVGKKAITLPFARKGEIYDVDLFAAPLADSSLLGVPPSMSLLAGKLPRHEHHEDPWRTSADGALGSFGTGHLHGYLDYKGDVWGLSANAGFAASNGHVDNSSFNKYDLGGLVHSIVATDNPILKSFRAEAGATYSHNAYGMFGIPGSSVRRTHSDAGITANMGTLNRTGGVLDIEFTTHFNSVGDAYSSGDSSVSIVSPVVRAAYTVPVKRVALSAALSYASSSLSYQHPTETAAKTELSAAAAWNGGNRWKFDVGAKMGGGSGSKGNDLSFFMPFGTAEYAVDSMKTLRLWFHPEMNFSTYGEHLEVVPYIAREMELQPERRPVEIGGSLELRDNAISFIVSAAYAKYSAKEIVVASAGIITLEYPEAAMATVGVEGSYLHGRNGRLEISGTFTSAHEPGSTIQLPMVPTTKLTAREELMLSAPLSLWGSLNFENSRNADREGLQSIPSTFIVNCGAYFAVARRLVLGGEITNLFNVQYEWWKDYPAPRIGFNVTAKVNFQ